MGEWEKTKWQQTRKNHENHLQVRTSSRRTHFCCTSTSVTMKDSIFCKTLRHFVMSSKNDVADDIFNIPCSETYGIMKLRNKETNME